MKITRRMGTAPAQRCTPDNVGCPDVLQLESGEYAVIGKVPGAPHGITVKEMIKHGAGVAINEMMVIVPRDVIEAAALQIAEEMQAATQGATTGAQ